MLMTRRQVLYGLGCGLAAALASCAPVPMPTPTPTPAPLKGSFTVDYGKARLEELLESNRDFILHNTEYGRGLTRLLSYLPSDVSFNEERLKTGKAISGRSSDIIVLSRSEPEEAYNSTLEGVENMLAGKQHEAVHALQDASTVCRDTVDDIIRDYNVNVIPFGLSRDEHFSGIIAIAPNSMPLDAVFDEVTGNSPQRGIYFVGLPKEKSEAIKQRLGMVDNTLIDCIGNKPSQDSEYEAATLREIQAYFSSFLRTLSIQNIKQGTKNSLSINPDYKGSYTDAQLDRAIEAMLKGYSSFLSQNPNVFEAHYQMARIVGRTQFDFDASARSYPSFEKAIEDLPKPKTPFDVIRFLSSANERYKNEIAAARAKNVDRQIDTDVQVQQKLGNIALSAGYKNPLPFRITFRFEPDTKPTNLKLHVNYMTVHQ